MPISVITPFSQINALFSHGGIPLETPIAFITDVGTCPDVWFLPMVVHNFIQWAKPLIHDTSSLVTQVFSRRTLPQSGFSVTPYPTRRDGTQYLISVNHFDDYLQTDLLALCGTTLTTYEREHNVKKTADTQDEILDHCTVFGCCVEEVTDKAIIFVLRVLSLPHLDVKLRRAGASIRLRLDQVTALITMVVDPSRNLAYS